MKRIILYLAGSLFLLGCKRGTIDEVVGESRFIWRNRSDHVIRFIAREYTNYNPREEALLFEQYLRPDRSFEYFQFGGFGDAPWPEDVEFSSVTVRFDDQEEVTYVRKIENFPYGILSPPEGYPEEHELFLADSYKKETTKTNGLISTTWTYTFTNADYEAAREWAERQKDE